MHLKDRFKEQDEKEKLWYDRAFGSLRNMMKIELSFTPPSDQVPPGKFLIVAKILYDIFPEMVEEFGTDKFPAQKMYTMETDQIDEYTQEYYLELDVPYGTY